MTMSSYDDCASSDAQDSDLWFSDDTLQESNDDEIDSETPQDSNTNSDDEVDCDTPQDSSDMCFCDNINMNDESKDSCDSDNDSDIFELIEQYYTLYKEVIKEQRDLCCFTKSDIEMKDAIKSIDKLKTSADSLGVTARLKSTDTLTESKAELDQKESATKQKSDKKHEHFEKGTREGDAEERKESGNISDEPPTNENGEVLEPPTEDEPESMVEEQVEEEELSAEEKIEAMLRQIEHKREVLEEKQQSEIERERDLKIRLKIQREESSQYENKLFIQYTMLSANKEENRKLCQQLNEALQELKGKQRTYEKSSRTWDLSTLHRTEKQTRINEFHILMVRNLELKIELVGRNLNRLKRDIRKHKTDQESQTYLENQSEASTIIQHLQAVKNFAKSKRKSQIESSFNSALTKCC